MDKSEVELGESPAAPPVDAAPSYLIHMAFRSTLSYYGPDIAQGFFYPGESVSQGTLQQSLK